MLSWDWACPNIMRFLGGLDIYNICMFLYVVLYCLILQRTNCKVRTVA